MSENTSSDIFNQPTVPKDNKVAGPPDVPALAKATQHPAPPVLTSMIGKEFGNYIILEEIGRGGMGVVYKARQKKPDRIVALKMIIGGKLASKDDLKRFVSEAEASARLEHRHIVTVYEVGELDEQHFFSMEFVYGQSLADLVRDGPIPSKKAARYLETTALALHFAHTHGFLHRDLKPSNIMIDQYDDPRVMDFGLVKRVGAPSKHTRTGAILGTPSYMSPEQAGGKVNQLTVSADIYGLGAVLYELLTGKPPFQSETHLDTLLHVMQSEPVPPKMLNPKIDADLETICLKCLEKDAKNRYASAQELADDLARYLRGESIHARQFNMLDRLTRMLEHSHHDAAFHAWSTMLFWLAAIIFAEHCLVFLLAWFGASEFWLLTARLSQFILIGYVFWRNRKSRLLPRTGPERELWTIWAGYLIAYCAGYVVLKSLLWQDWFDVKTVVNVPQTENLLMYPFSSLLSGLAFFIMGSNYWGRFYAIGLAFLGMAVLSTWHIHWAPLEFGVLWGLALTSIGWRLHKLGVIQRESQAIDTAETVAQEM